MAAIQEVSAVVSISETCESMNIPRATYYRILSSKAKEPKAPRTKSPRALSDEEQKAVLDVLHSERFVDTAPATVVATLLDEGTYLCSTRTAYRILNGEGEIKERRRQARRPEYTKPELLASGPNQVWSWDITKLKGPAKWTYHYLYVMIDIYSRYVVGWMIAECESSNLAQLLIEESCEKQGVEPGQLIIHSDRGSPMIAKGTAQLMADLGITKSFSRPHVSDDNPFSEAHFKTLKYRPDFPRQFGSIEDAKAHCRRFFNWYNNEHRHSGIAHLTPADVHFERAEGMVANRQLVLNKAYEAHPERFVAKSPIAAPLPLAVWINPPTKTNDESRGPVEAPSESEDGASGLGQERGTTQ